MSLTAQDFLECCSGEVNTEVARKALTLALAGEIASGLAHGVHASTPRSMADEDRVAGIIIKQSTVIARGIVSEILADD
jgi:hypothetical protein